MASDIGLVDCDLGLVDCDIGLAYIYVGHMDLWLVILG